MGGNALKTIDTKRLSAADYHRLVPVVLGEIATRAPHKDRRAVVKWVLDVGSVGMDVAIMTAAKSLKKSLTSPAP